MSIAEELAAKHMNEHYRASSVGELPAAGMDATVAAINEALELAAQEAENIGRLAVAGESGREAARFAAERIRRLKSPADPVQPTDASPAQESDHARL